ncbi:MAG TPA: hypothetical protein VF718_11160 [Allosphingosinicella sp.]|jgi:DNA-binding MarR family transcriptional regulator
MSNASGEPPLRQLTRLRSELQIATAQLTARLFPEDPFLAMEFGIAARICLPDWTCGAGVARPERAARAISVRKMALSLGNSFETTRRHCLELIERGAFAESPQGVALAATEANEALVLSYYLGVHDRFVRLIEDVSTTCDLDFPVARGRDFEIADVIERGLDVLLQPVDTFRLSGMSRSAHLLWAALTAVAVRGVTYDPLLCRRFARSIPPDEVRAAISLRRLAAALAIPYATAWRHAQRLEARGLVTRVGSDRWTVLQGNLIARHVQEIAISPTLLLLPRLRELALLGLDPARAAEYYRQGRPALADFGTSAEQRSHPI